MTDNNGFELTLTPDAPAAAEAVPELTLDPAAPAAPEPEKPAVKS